MTFEANPTKMEYHWIDQSSMLDPLVARISNSDYIALDTEADSFHHYLEKLCLVQISIPSPRLNFLLDPLAGMDELQLWENLKSKHLIFHGANFDVRLLRRHRNFAPRKVFDTLIAAQITGEPQLGYSSLVKIYCGVTLTKTSQQADWSRRPLTQEMLDYAAADTHYLFAIKEHFERKLHELGRYEWFEESCGQVVRSALRPDESEDPDRIWRISGANILSNLGRAILRELWNWREDQARTADVSSFRVISNEYLLNVSRKVSELPNTASIPEPLIPKFLYRHQRADSFVEAIRKALALPPEAWPPKLYSPRPLVDKSAQKRATTLKHKRDALATELKIDPTIIASKATLEKLGESENPDWDRFIEQDRILPWQARLLRPA